MKNLIVGGVFLLSSIAAMAAPIQVEVTRGYTQGGYPVGVGSLVSMLFPGQSAAQPGLFLGRLVQPGGQLDSFMFFDPQHAVIYYVPASAVSMSDSGLQNVLRLYEQVGGTCTAYAIDDYLQQLHLSGFVGNGQLGATLSTEEGRTQLLANAINEYYLEPQHQYSTNAILNGIGKGYGFTCKAKSFSDLATLQTFLETTLATGTPVAVGFNVPPDMFNAPFTLIDEAVSPTQAQDNRLWIPRQIGQRASGGHTVVAIASFIWNSRLELLMLDSDWDAPRVWDFNSVFNSRTALEEVEFDVCH